MKVGKQYRHFSIRAEDVNTEKRTVDLSFSSEAPVERWYGTEILDHSPSSVRLGRLRDSGPLLSNHDTECQIGVVESAEVRNGKGYATVRFSKSVEATEIFNDVMDGIRRNVSVGYQAFKATEEQITGDPAMPKSSTYRITDWEPLELSIVAVPADPTVGVGRSDSGGSEVEIEVRQKSRMSDTPAAPAATGTAAQPAAAAPARIEINDEDRQRIATEERSRVCEIKAMGARFKCVEAADKAIEEGHPLEHFRHWLLTEHLKAKPVGSSAPALSDMERSGKRKYSLNKLVRDIDARGKAEGFEAEVSTELEKSKGTRTCHGMLVPLAVFGVRSPFASGMQTRTNQVAVAADGGYTVDTELLSAEFIGKLDNQPIVERAGARRLTGVTGDLAIPTQTGGLTAYWLSESGTVTNSSVTFGLLTFAPKRLQINVPWTRQLAMQSSLDVEGLLRMDANTRLILAIDLAAIQGTGANGQPKGLFTYNTSTSGINTVTYSAAATFAKTREQIAALLSDNTSYLGTPYFIIDPTSWSKWSTKAIDAGSGKFLWNGSDQNGDVNGYPGAVSNHLPSNKSVCGVFSQMIIPMWEGVDVLVDPYSRKKEGIIEMSITTHLDIGVRYPEAFVVSTDSAAQ